MVAQAKRKKAKQRRRKFTGADKNMPEFKAEWINAFLIILLDKSGGIQGLTLEQLEKFDELKGGKEPEFSWNGELKAFIIKSPGYEEPIIEMPDEPKIII